jgi:hypothetical protein
VSVARSAPHRRRSAAATRARFKADGTPAVRERYWLTFQPGEIRVCTNCHGVNTHDVFGVPIPSNPPAALRELVAWWRDEVLPVPEPGALGGAVVALAALLSLSPSASTRSRG